MLRTSLFDVAIPLTYFAALMFYYGVPEHLWGKSFGKLITRTFVMSTDGGRPSGAQIFRRTLCRFIPFEPFSILFGGEYPVGWHDSLSGTRVVNKA
jgi:uncharacterized RDD family membrane protein YckC